MDRVESIAHALGGAKRTANGWLCKCPCHNDKSASLSLTLASNGKGITLNCFAGCSWEDVKSELKRLGLIDTQPRMPRADYAPAKRDKYAGAKFYVYKDLLGNILCRKVKLPNKIMWIQRFENGEWINALAGLQVPLYNIQAVAAADIVYLVEGEKDAETLMGCGLCATTNHAGAKSWAPGLNDSLKGKCVIIIPDNDETGKKRVGILTKALSSVVKELRLFIPDGVPEKGDITDWVEAGGDSSKIFERSTIIAAGPKSKKASRDDYYQLFDTVFDNPRRCIFNEKLMHRSGDLWNPCINDLEVVKSEALLANETRDSKFSVSNIQPHFFAYERSKPVEFLVDIPEWDGEDRISAMAYLVKMRQSSEVTEEAFSELLKEWCALVFKRLHDPMIQNRILVLQGGQGIGKDTWTSMLVDGLGQFCIPLSVVKEDKDTYLNLHRGLIMKISEFDKTAKTEVSTLKDIITAPSTNLRAPYDKDSKLRFSRCSFISSANIEDLLRDSTGNRRFLIFEIDSIDYAYMGWDTAKIKAWQAQCLAQMVYLAECNYTASAESWRLMRGYIERKTPSDLAVDIIDQFIEDVRAEIVFGPNTREVLPADKTVREIITKLVKQTGFRYATIRGILQNKLGVYKKAGSKRFWAYRLPEPTFEHETE